MRLLAKICALLALSTFLGSLLPGMAANAQITDPTGTEDGRRGALNVYKYDARTTALGDANVGGLHNLMNMNMNPASLSFTREPRSIQADAFQNWNNNMMMETVAFPMLVNSKHALAGQLSRSHGGMKQTNLLGTSPHPQPSLSMYQFDIGYAYTIQGVLSLGILNNFSYTENPNNNAQYWTSFTTLGVTYSPSQSISYGASFRGLGRSPTYEFIEDGETILGSQNLQEILELGATMRFPVEGERTVMSLSLSNEKRFGQNGIWYKGGLELFPTSYLALRGGALLHTATNIRAPRFGIGFVSDAFELDYALSFERQLYQRYHQLSLTLHLGRM